VSLQPAPTPLATLVPGALRPVQILPARANLPSPPPASASNTPPKEVSVAIARGEQSPTGETAGAREASQKHQPEPAAAEGTETTDNSQERAAENQEIRIRNILQKYGESAQQGRNTLAEGRKNLAARLEQAGLQVAAYSHFPEYRGARVGAIRTLTFDNVKPAVAREVMNRYDIRITQRFISQSGPSYLSSASAGGGVYRPTDKPGYYEVFEISPKAYEHMVVLEQNWLVSHGYDPRTTSVDIVEFGIVQKTPNFWDLDILRMEVQQVAEIGRPTIPAEPTESPESGRPPAPAGGADLTPGVSPAGPAGPRPTP